MNLAHNAYASTAAPTRTDRNNEFDTFSRITKNLKTADQKTDYPGFMRALHENRKLWTLLAVDVSGPENGLPETLRARLFYLAEFTFEHTSRVIAGSATVDALIDVNISVMRGLRQSAVAS